MNRQQISFYYQKLNPTNISLTQRRQSCLGTQCQKTVQHFFISNFSINEKTPATYLPTFYNLQTSAFSNRGAASCRVDLSPMITAWYLLFTFSKSFRNHIRPSEVHGPQVKYSPRHKYMLHSLENLAQPGRKPKSVYGLFFFFWWLAWFNSITFIYLYEILLWQNRKDLHRDVKYLLSFPPSSVSCWHSALQKAPQPTLVCILRWQQSASQCRIYPRRINIIFTGNAREVLYYTVIL